MKFGEKFTFVILTLLMLGGLVIRVEGADAPPEQAKNIVLLSQEEIVRLGVETSPAQPTTFTPQVRGYGVVTSLSTVAQTESDIRTAMAAVADSQAALVRATHLAREGAVSVQLLASAQHQASSDQTQLALADRKEIGTFGMHAPWRGPPRDDTILTALTNGTSQIVEASFPLGVAFDALPSALAITRLDTQPGQKSWISRRVWEAPADPTIPGRSFFALVDRSQLAQGEHVLVYAAIGAPVRGVRIPSDAVILSEDRPWCYVAVSPRHFQRVQVDLKLQVVGGYFVVTEIAPGQPVVIKGTGLLLSRELGVATPGQD